MAHPEAYLISAVIRTGEYQQLAKHGITSEIFHVHDAEMEWLERYIASHSKTPSKAALRNSFPDFAFYKVDDTAHWCGEVQKTHKQQALIDLFEKGMDMIDLGDEDQALDMVNHGIAKIRTAASGVRSDFDVFDNWEELYEDVSNRVDRVRTQGHAGIPTGFATLDSVMGGIQPGWLGIVAARLGEGKTWTGIRMAYAASVTGHDISYFSLEQSRRQIGLRVHAFGSRQFAKSPFNPMDLMKGKNFDLREYKQFLIDMQSKRGSGHFRVHDGSRGTVTPDTVASVIETEQPAMVVIDYLTLMGTTGDDWKGVAKLSSGLQTIAQRYDVPIVALSQVNRLGIGKDTPGTEHLSQADAIGQDADFVLTMKKFGDSVQKMGLPKFRHGASGQKWWAKFSPGTGEYEEISEQDAAEILEAEGEED